MLISSQVRQKRRYLVSENDIISTLISILKHTRSPHRSLPTAWPSSRQLSSQQQDLPTVKSFAQPESLFRVRRPLHFFFSLTHVYPFSGDSTRHHALLTALRATFSSPTLTPPPSASSPPVIPISEESIGVDDVAKRITEWKELARFLKRNVVQGVRSDDGAWSGYPSYPYVDKAKGTVRTSSNRAHRTRWQCLRQEPAKITYYSIP